jgi:hypothetical protein
MVAFMFVSSLRIVWEIAIRIVWEIATWMISL